MNMHDHDNDALPGEEELKSLYRSLPRKEPSPALDSAIQRAAADAVRADQRRSVTRWPVAVASVAVLVVAAGLGWRTMQQPTSLPQGPASRTVVVSAAPANEPAQAMSAQSSAELAKAPAAPLAAAAPEARIAAPAAAKRDNIRSAMKTNVVAPVVATEQPPAPATEPAPLTAMSEDRMAAAAPPPAPAAPAPVADAAPSAYAPQTAMRATAISGALSQRATAMKVMAAPAAAPDSTAANANDTPAQELEKIRQLFALHRHDEAVQRLTAFRQAHPDVPLPDDLRAQLPDHE
jgi:Meckel syndrome type 1 protein